MLAASIPCIRAVFLEMINTFWVRGIYPSFGFSSACPTSSHSLHLIIIMLSLYAVPPLLLSLLLFVLLFMLMFHCQVLYFFDLSICIIFNYFEINTELLYFVWSLIFCGLTRQGKPGPFILCCYLSLSLSTSLICLLPVYLSLSLSFSHSLFLSLSPFYFS